MMGIVRYARYAAGTSATLLLIWAAPACAPAQPVAGVPGFPAAGEPLPAEQVVVMVQEGFSGIDERRRQVIRNQAEWAAFWQQHHAVREPVAGVPQVDFTRNFVLVASMGEQPSGGHSIQMEGARRLDGGYIVLVTETSPAPGCPVTLGLTSPILVARLPRTDGPIQFGTRSVLEEC